LESLDPLSETGDGANWEESFLSEVNYSSGTTTLATTSSAAVANPSSESALSVYSQPRYEELSHLPLNSVSWTHDTDNNRHCQSPSGISSTNEAPNVSTPPLSNDADSLPAASALSSSVSDEDSDGDENDDEDGSDKDSEAEDSKSLHTSFNTTGDDISSSGKIDNNNVVVEKRVAKRRLPKRKYKRHKIPRHIKPLPWSPWEDKRLVEAVEKHGFSDWRDIAQFVSTRTLKQCSFRWYNMLKLSTELDRSDDEENDTEFSSAQSLDSKKRKRSEENSEVSTMSEKQNGTSRESPKRLRKEEATGSSVRPLRQEHLEKYLRIYKHAPHVSTMFFSFIPLPYRGAPPVLRLRDPTLNELYNTPPSRTMQCVNWDQWFIGSSGSFSFSSMSQHSKAASKLPSCGSEGDLQTSQQTFASTSAAPLSHSPSIS
jgi:hypothetical protein